MSEEADLGMSGQVKYDALTAGRRHDLHSAAMRSCLVPAVLLRVYAKSSTIQYVSAISQFCFLQAWQ